MLSQWIKNGHPPMDVNGIDIRRIHPFQSNGNYIRERVSESLGLALRHALALSPNGKPHAAFAARPFIRSRTSLGAVYGEVNGWERPNWYARSRCKARI